MLRFRRLGYRLVQSSLLVIAAALSIGAACAALSARQASAAAGVTTTREDSSDYGAGGHRETDTNSAGKNMEVREYDAKGNLRSKKTIAYNSASPGNATSTASASSAAAAPSNATSVALENNGQPISGADMALVLANMNKVSLGKTDPKGAPPTSPFDLANGGGASVGLDLANLGKVPLHAEVDECEDGSRQIYLVGPGGQLPPPPKHCKRKRLDGDFYWGKPQQVAIDVGKGTTTVTELPAPTGITQEIVTQYAETGALTSETTSTFDSLGGLTSTDITRFDTRGDLTSDLLTHYQPTGMDTSDWNIGTHGWTNQFIPYKSKLHMTTPSYENSWIPTNDTVGALVPRDFHPGDTITGYLADKNYAEAFKSVPGLSEYSFPIQMYHLPDGEPEWSRVQLGVKNYGFGPVNPNGTFSFHIPLNWKGPLELQAYQPDSMTGMGPSDATLEIGNPVAAPSLPQGTVTAQAQSELQQEMVERLIDLWNEAFDREDELDLHYEFGEHYKGEIGDLEYDLNDCYDEIDYVASQLPTKLVTELARGMAQYNRDINEEIRTGTQELTAEQTSELNEYDAWANFLEDEADNREWMDMENSFFQATPDVISPVWSQDRLIALRGTSSGDPDATHFTFGGRPITPIGGTPDVKYFMPPDGTTAGLNNFVIDTPGIPQITMPIFYLTLTMSADATNLLKGQSTMYHVTLSGLNGLPSSAWSSSFFPSDLVSPSDYQGSAPGTAMPGTSRTGTITLTITNESPGVISMQNVFKVLDAQSFAPSGSFHFDGGVGAIANGGFSILGVATPFLLPELGSGGLPNSPGGFAPNSLGSTALGLYDNYLGLPPSTPVGNPPATSASDAATQRVTDAQQKVSTADSNYLKVADDERIKWNAAKTQVPDDVSSRYSTAETKEFDAWREWNKALDNFVKSSTSENNATLETTANARAATMDELKDARKALIDHFTPADRDAWQAAHDALDSAEIDRTLAEEELRDAREGLKNLSLPSLLKYGF
jgi:hypothetical protein